MEAIGFDFNHGRLDVSLHPFSGGTPDDVRITTRYDTEDFSQALMAVVHETGHALYERGLPRSYARQPVGEPRAWGFTRANPLSSRCKHAEPTSTWTGSAEPCMGLSAARPRMEVENLSRLWRLSSVA